MSCFRLFSLTSNQNSWLGQRGHPGSSIPLVLRIPTLTVLLDMGSRMAFKILTKSTPVGHGGTCPGLRRFRQEDGKFKGNTTKQHT